MTNKEIKAASNLMHNITVRAFTNSDKKQEFMIFKGKGTGCQIAGTLYFEECLLFDKEFQNVEYKHIETSTGKKGGAWFYKSTDKMFFREHPFKNDFIIK